MVPASNSSWELSRAPRKLAQVCLLRTSSMHRISLVVRRAACFIFAAYLQISTVGRSRQKDNMSIFW